MLKNRVGTFVLYAVMIAVAVLAFLAIDVKGLALSGATTTPIPSGTSTGPQTNALVHILLALAVIIMTARLLSGLFKRFGHPAVIGEVLGGIVLGPSLLGRLFPEASVYLLPASSAPLLSTIAQLRGHPLHVPSRT